MRRRLLPITAILLAAVAVATPAAAQPAPEAILVGRALLAPDASAPAPFPAAPNTEPAPAPGARQPVGGFSALLDAAGPDTFWAMPDNGFGAKANSHSFLLRVYRVHADFETARGGSGKVQILDWITLRDPDKRVPFGIITKGTTERLLTGGDFDIESMRVARDGTLWFGEEFGPFLLHTDTTGKVLEAPIPLPGVESRTTRSPPSARRTSTVPTASRLWRSPATARRCTRSWKGRSPATIRPPDGSTPSTSPPAITSNACPTTG